jgi:hypothetical protein
VHLLELADVGKPEQLGVERDRTDLVDPRAGDGR